VKASMQQTQLPFDAPRGVHRQRKRVHGINDQPQAPPHPPVATGLAALDVDFESGAGGSAGRLPMLLTVRDVEAELQLGRTPTYELLRSGEIPALRIGRALRIPREALERWIDDHVGLPR